MGNNSSSSSFPNYIVEVQEKYGKKYEISYHRLVEHILLLRKVINHPEMRREGSILDEYIKNYCKRMSQDRLRTTYNQSKLPWQIEWIWHVHRLHSIQYSDDCQKQLSNGLVNKQTETILNMNYEKKLKSKRKSSSKNSRSLFIPSIDLSNAIIQQNHFLEKFQQHFLYSYDLNKLNKIEFTNLIKDYLSFMISAKNDRTIIPTFGVNLIWHTHMRYTSDYQQFSTTFSGFILNYNDSIEQSIILNNDEITGHNWKSIYESNTYQKYSQTNKYTNSTTEHSTYNSNNKLTRSNKKSDHDYGYNWDYPDNSYDFRDHRGSYGGGSGGGGGGGGSCGGGSGGGGGGGSCGGGGGD